ncbi:DUF1453 domain-containing protein [Streptomyces sp. NPDC044780]|uniref:DUF1453 domain-containing protein n=1 Tax=unclassified Streptomyces TaxID=2593676 RepID=UPI0034084753
MSPLDIVLIVGGVGYILARRMIGELLQAKAMLVAPVALSVVGVFRVRDALPLSAAAIALIAAGCLLSVVVGLLRGTTVHLGERDGVLWMRYRVSTLLLWLVNGVLKVAMIPVEHAVSPASAHAANQAVLLSIGLGVLAETLVVLGRAMRTGSTVVWEKGQDGTPHRTSPAFDQVRGWVRDAEGGGQRPWGPRDW